MAVEIERKFLVTGDEWRPPAPGIPMRQGYLAVTGRCAVRVRTMGARAYIGVKSAGLNIVRREFEYAVPVEEANAMLDTLAQSHVIEKTRYCVPFGGHTWDIDEFHGLNAGLVIAEIELSSEIEAFELPPWVGPEVSHDPRYLNSSLSVRPYREWRGEPRV